MKKYICTICGYVYEGENPPAQCPQCKASSDKFIEKQEGKKEYACEHVIASTEGIDSFRVCATTSTVSAVRSACIWL